MSPFRFSQTTLNYLQYSSSAKILIRFQQLYFQFLASLLQHNTQEYFTYMVKTTYPPPKKYQQQSDAWKLIFLFRTDELFTLADVQPKRCLPEGDQMGDSVRLQMPSPLTPTLTFSSLLPHLRQRTAKPPTDGAIAPEFGV